LNERYLENNLNELIDKTNKWAINNTKTATFLNGLVAGFIILYVTPVESILALSQKLKSIIKNLI
jgi:hypothetical protein